MLQSRPCIFCEIVAGRVPEPIVFEDAAHIAFFPLEHINPGHLLLIPKRHTDYLFDMDAAGYHALWAAAARLAPGMRSVISAVRIGVVVEGFGVPHVHVHLVPLYARDELNPTRAKPLDAAEGERLRNMLRHEFGA
ncbi:MAG: HIT family protein [Vicinamibacterales bacterium]